MKAKTTSVVYRFDSSCEMESLEVNGKCIAEGNYWDHHIDPDMIVDAFKAAGVRVTLKRIACRYTDACDWEPR